MNTPRIFGAKILLIISAVLVIIVIFFSISLFTSQIPNQKSTQPLPTSTQTSEERQIRESFIPIGEEGINEEELEEYQQMRRDAEEAFAERKERLPFLMQLPYKEVTFTIEISPYSDTVYISTSPPTENREIYRQQAIDWLESSGANFNNFTIEYKN